MRYRELGRYGMFLLLGLMIFARPVFSLFYVPVAILLQLADAFLRLWT